MKTIHYKLVKIEGAEDDLLLNCAEAELCFPCTSEADGQQKIRDYLKTLNWPEDLEFKCIGEGIFHHPVCDLTECH
jgi:hypothetical protein